MLIRVEWATACWEFCRCGWAARFAGRNRTECTMEDRKAKQTAADQNFRHAADRPREKS